MWLRDSLPFDVPDLRVFIYGYHSNIQHSPSRASIYDFTQEFTNAILSLRSGPEASHQSARTLPNANNTYQVAETPLILVGHSLGCIIIKQVRARLLSTLVLTNQRRPLSNLCHSSHLSRASINQSVVWCFLERLTVGSITRNYRISSRQNPLKIWFGTYDQILPFWFRSTNAFHTSVKTWKSLAVTKRMRPNHLN